jgi:hypothetical protein
MKGYKAFDKDLQCRGMQYEIGGTYELGDTPICCKRGFHFCKSISDCYKFYPKSDDTRICEVEALGEVVTVDRAKYCTNKIHVIREVANPRAKSNVNETCSGFCNSGNYNSGHWNSGDYNSGNYNSGNYNSGNGNCGNYNTGGYNSGDSNGGTRNAGNYNSGDYNCGNNNTGSCNTGTFNIGDWNNGDWNSGNWNNGDRNSGDRNIGNYNRGYYNNGYFNSGRWNTGIFNTEQMPTIKIFDKDSSWTMEIWCDSAANRIMSLCPVTHSNFVYEWSMNDEEKENHPEYKTLGGYTKIITVTEEDRQKWWDDLSNEEKQEVMSLPNFDADKFYQCTGIRV